MGSGIRCLPFYPKEVIGPKSITVESKMAKHNSRVDKEGWITIYSLKQVPEHAGEVVAEYNRLEVALHKKSGQKSDSVVNKDFLVSF